MNKPLCKNLQNIDKRKKRSGFVCISAAETVKTTHLQKTTFKDIVIEIYIYK